MQVSLDIPDTLAEQLRAAGKDPARAALEAVAIASAKPPHLCLLRVFFSSPP